MIRVSPPTDELATLLEASCLGELQPEQARRLTNSCAAIPSAASTTSCLCTCTPWSSGAGDRPGRMPHSYRQPVAVERRTQLAGALFSSSAPSTTQFTARSGYFLLGLAGGVSGGDGDFRGRALDRLRGACVPAWQVARQSPSPSPLDPRPEWSAGSPAWSIATSNSVQKSQLQDPRPKTQDPRVPRRQVRPDFRPDGNHV